MSKDTIYLDKNGNMRTMKELLSGKTQEQQQVIKYFFEMGSGCCGGTMSDENYKAMVAKVRGDSDYKQRALNKLGLDEDMVQEIPPVTFEGYSTNKSYAKRTSAGKWITSKYEIAWLFFGDEQVYLYSYAFSMDDGSKKEATNEYFYKDITSFSTASDMTESTTSKGKETVETHVFRMVVPGDKFICSMDATPDSENALAAMKQKLREKKNM